MVKVMSLLIKTALRLNVEFGSIFGVRAWTEMEIQCVKGMSRLK